MLPSNLNVNTGKTKRYNNNVLVGNTDMKIGSNKDINRDKKLPDMSKTVISADRDEPAEITIPHNLKMLSERHNDEKLAIILLLVGTGLIAYHFW